MDGPIVEGLYNEKWYNDDNITAAQYGYVLYENKILGRPRLRQLRVTNHSCTVHKKFQALIPECFAPYGSNKEDKSLYGPVNDTIADTAWHYQSSSELKGSSVAGLISTYSGSGYVQNLGVNYATSKAILDDLEQNLWLDRSTRVVLLDFTVYNANINLFCQIRLMVEFPATGGAIPTQLFNTVKLIRYVSSMDYFVLACEVLFILFTAYYTIEEIIEISRYRLHYFKTIWNILDVVIIIISYICIAFNVYRQVKVGQILDSLLENEDSFADFEFLSYWQVQFNNIVAFAIFLAWIKIFKYVSFNKTMTQLTTTLSRCAKDIFGFAVMFFIVFLAYAQLGYLLFGTLVEDYRTFAISIFTLFRIVLGDFDFEAMLEAHRILGPIFFLTYVFFVFFVLLNMFLAIINDTYSEVKADIATQKSEFELGDYFKKSYEKMLDKMNIKRDRVIDIQNALKRADLNKDGIIDFGEWRRDLKERGYTDVEIENVFSKYDIDGDRQLKDAEQRRFQDDLTAEENDLTKEIKGLASSYSNSDEIKKNNQFRNNSGRQDDNENDKNSANNRISYDEFAVLLRRVDRMEYSIGNIVSKIDSVLTKLETSEKDKMKRREAMTKILDSITDDNRMSNDAKHERLEKMLRDELETWDRSERQTPSPSNLSQQAGAPGAPRAGNGPPRRLSPLPVERPRPISGLSIITELKIDLEKRKTPLREVVLYILYLIIICIISFGRTNNSMFYFANMLMTAFLTTKTNDVSFNDIANIEDFWLVRRGSCKLRKNFQKRIFVQDCYAVYSSSTEDKSSFLPASTTITPHAWSYQTGSKLKSSSHYGFIAHYGDGGYVQEYTRNASSTMDILKELKENNWIDRATRVVFLDFTVYNANINLFCHMSFTLFRVILGDFDLYVLVKADATIGPIFFFTYVFFVYFVLLNMFLAIINDTYSKVQADTTTQTLKIEMGVFGKGYARILRRLNIKQEKITGIEDTLKQADHAVNFDEWKDILRARGYSDQEIKGYFAQYDSDGDGILDTDEQQRMRNDLLTQKNEINRGIKGLEHETEPVKQKEEDVDSEDERIREVANRLSYDQYLMLVGRVNQMEQAAESMVAERKPKKVHTSSINDNQNITLYLNPLSDVNLVCDDIDPKLIVDSARLKLQDDNVNDFSSESSSSYSESVYEYSDSFERKLEQNLEWDSENNNSDIDDIWISNEKMRREGSNWSLYNMV
ncbi:unnamed protein product [Didymodactylos carnosus]|nr:unnamed protein product [Didymodactylos carnosus]CAF3582535.1 unnamed protein product [Didymodactylos carnosus]